MSVNCITREIVEAAKRFRAGERSEADVNDLSEFAASILPDEPLPDSYDRSLSADYLRLQHDCAARALREVDRFKESRNEQCERSSKE